MSSFLLVYNINIGNFDEKSLSSMDNKEILQMVKSKVNTYMHEDDINFKSLFMDSLPNYAREIGFENTADILLPIIDKIVIIINIA
jgi:hypothetical protein